MEEENYKEISSSLIKSINAWIPFLKEVDGVIKEKDSWINNLIDCFEFIKESPQEIVSNESLLSDVYKTLQLLHSAFIDNEEYAFIVLRKKYRTIYTPQQVGEAFRKMFQKLKDKKEREEPIIENDILNFKNDNGEFKSVEQIMSELKMEWNEDIKPEF